MLVFCIRSKCFQHVFVHNWIGNAGPPEPFLIMLMMISFKFVTSPYCIDYVNYSEKYVCAKQEAF